MTARKPQYFRLGLLVMIAFVVFTYGLYRISDREGLFGDTITVYADFRDLRGLRTGNNVRFAGIKVGSVTAVEIHSDTCLRVEMLLEGEARHYLRQNARVAIGSDGLVGNMLVNISPAKQGDSPLVKEGQFLQSVRPLETADMLAILSQTNLAMASMSTQLLAIAEKINSGEGTLARLLNDATLARDFAQSVRQLRDLTANLEQSSWDLRAFTQHVQAGEGNLGYLLQDTSLRSQVGRWTVAVDSLLIARADPLARHLVAAASELEVASGNIAQLTDQLGASSVFQTFLRDSTAGGEIQSTLEHLRSASEKLDENMIALRASWPFRRYFRKQADTLHKE